MYDFCDGKFAVILMMKHGLNTQSRRVDRTTDKIIVSKGWVNLS